MPQGREIGSERTSARASWSTAGALAAPLLPANNSQLLSKTGRGGVRTHAFKCAPRVLAIRSAMVAPPGHLNLNTCVVTCHTEGGVGVGTRPWWLALLACGGAYWPLTLEPSAMTSRHPYYCGHSHCRGHPLAWVGIQNAGYGGGGVSAGDIFGGENFGTPKFWCLGDSCGKFRHTQILGTIDAKSARPEVGSPY